MRAISLLVAVLACYFAMTLLSPLTHWLLKLMGLSNLIISTLDCLAVFAPLLFYDWNERLAAYAKDERSV